MQPSLFDAVPRRRVLDVPDAQIWLESGFLSVAEAADWLARLRAELPWRQEQIRLYGKVHDVPRLSCWLGEGHAYTYSGITHYPVAWGFVDPLRRRIEAATGDRYDSALANCYRDGADTVGWHADDEPDLGPEPHIASLSLGGTRRFVLRHKRTREKVELELTAGSLLWMGGCTQACWEHTVPRTRRPVAERVNLTLRRMGG